MAGVVLVEVREQTRLGDGEALPGPAKVGAPLFGDQDLARPDQVRGYRFGGIR
ncbi:hypothetical protein GTZ78_36540 [Streptomyces sp. SID8361]|uniref:hypothetical protein n=1 Tax=Streptomyces sp. MnatMP-M27 TaxID=1839768 RepID=UPI00081EF511|nr:hypothetical protein [Streptomyces sp. MnatMP-M27]MYU16035.1 hypothetical protein [Streptomyces sp. SID8361]SCG10590.1 hypothetical protein GA0115260_111484 [Streptomyces sp. MnatMP-M27]